MATIWKFPLTDTKTELDLPRNAQVLSVHVQESEPCLWALVDPSEPPETRKFRAYATGESIQDSLGDFIGTVLLQGGAYVLHVFEAP